MKAFSAWVALFIWGVVVCFACILKTNIWFSFMVIFSFVSGLSVMFLFFVSTHSNPYLVSGTLVVGVVGAMASMGVTSLSKCSDMSYFLGGGGFSYILVSYLLVSGLLLMKCMLSWSCKTFRPLCH